MNERLLDLKKPAEYRLRMEKLLVRCWMYGKDRDELRAKNIIGVTTRKINPFKGNDGNWVVNTCFKLYGNSVQQLMQHFPPFTSSRQEREIALLREFFSVEGALDLRNQRKLDSFVKRFLASKSRIFRSLGELSAADKRSFLMALRQCLREKNDRSENGKLFWKTIAPFLGMGKRLNVIRLKSAILNHPGLPFKWSNRYMATFIAAVDADLSGKNSAKLWEAFKRCEKDLRANFPVEARRLSSRIHDPSCWILFDVATGKYKKGDDFDENKWLGHVKNAASKEGHFHSFRTGTLGQLIIETGR
jgi:hypothetical protein